MAENNKIIVGERKKKGFVDLIIRRLEKFLARHRFLAKAYTVFFKKMTIDEFEMVDLPDGSKVVNIGCGSLPHTLLILANAKDWQFLGIDRDEVAVQEAEKMVDHYNLLDKIKIKLAEGVDCDVSDFDLIIVSHGVEPKMKILETLGNKMSKNSIILYRTTSDRLDKIYGRESIPKNLKVKKVFYRIDGIKAILLSRNEKNK